VPLSDTNKLFKINPLSASDVNSRDDAVVAYSGCSASYRRGENLLQNRILHFAFKLSQSSHGWFAINSRSKQSVTMKHRLTIHSTTVTSTWNGY